MGPDNDVLVVMDRYPKIKCDYADAAYLRMAITGMIGFVVYTVAYFMFVVYTLYKIHVLEKKHVPPTGHVRPADFRIFQNLHYADRPCAANELNRERLANPWSEISFGAGGAVTERPAGEPGAAGAEEDEAGGGH